MEKGGSRISSLYDFGENETILSTLGIKIIKYERDEVIATMQVLPRTHQPHGIMHGGVSLVLAETVASAGSYIFIDQDVKVAVGLEINANHVRSKSKGMLTAVGVPVHIGRRTIVWDMRISDEEGRLICISRCTIAVIDKEHYDRLD